MRTLYSAAVLVPVPVEDVVMGFHAPVVAVERQEASGIGALGGMIGQAVDDLGGVLAGLFVDALAFDEEGLSDVREVQRVRLF
jgi:hypothetical protein